MAAFLPDLTVFIEFDLTSWNEHLLTLFTDILLSSTSYRVFTLSWIICWESGMLLVASFGSILLKTHLFNQFLPDTWQIIKIKYTYKYLSTSPQYCKWGTFQVKANQNEGWILLSPHLQLLKVYKNMAVINCLLLVTGQQGLFISGVPWHKNYEDLLFVWWI